MSYAPHQSLYDPNGDTAAKRAAYTSVTANTSIPSGATNGFSIRNNRWLHGLVDLDDGTSIDFEVWLYNRHAEKWYLDTRLGVLGVVTVAQTADDNPKGFILEVAFADRVALRFQNPVGAPANGATAWLSAN